MAGDSSLPHFMQRLPQELFDKIYDDVFTAPDGSRVAFSRGFHYPVQFHISKTSRKKFAASYFGNSTFVFEIGKHFAWTGSVHKLGFERIVHAEVCDGSYWLEDPEGDCKDCEDCEDVLQARIAEFTIVMGVGRFSWSRDQSAWATQGLQEPELHRIKVRGGKETTWELEHFDSHTVFKRLAGTEQGAQGR